MTIQECEIRDNRFIQNIRSVLVVHDQLRDHAAKILVTIENASVVVRGQLPSSELKGEVVASIRRAGVLSRVCDLVQVR